MSRYNTEEFENAYMAHVLSGRIREAEALLRSGIAQAEHCGDPTNAIYLYKRLAMQLADNGEAQRARRVLVDCESRYPERELPAVLSAEVFNDYLHMPEEAIRKVEAVRPRLASQPALLQRALRVEALARTSLGDIGRAAMVLKQMAHADVSLLDQLINAGVELETCRALLLRTAADLRTQLAREPDDEDDDREACQEQLQRVESLLAKLDKERPGS